MVDKSSLTIKDIDTKDSKIKINPMTGEIKGELVATGVNYNTSKVEVEFTYDINAVDYREKFEEKREALHDMVEDGDGFTKEEIHDLVLTANKALAQE